MAYHLQQVTSIHCCCVALPTKSVQCVISKNTSCRVKRVIRKLRSDSIISCHPCHAVGVTPAKLFIPYQHLLPIKPTAPNLPSTAFSPIPCRIQYLTFALPPMSPMPLYPLHAVTPARPCHPPCSWPRAAAESRRRSSHAPAGSHRRVTSASSINRTFTSAINPILDLFIHCSLAACARLA